MAPVEVQLGDGTFELRTQGRACICVSGTGEVRAQQAREAPRYLPVQVLGPPLCNFHLTLRLLECIRSRPVNGCRARSTASVVSSSARIWERKDGVQIWRRAKDGGPRFAAWLGARAANATRFVEKAANPRPTGLPRGDSARDAQ